MARLLLFLALAALGLAAAALISCLSAARDRVDLLPRAVWVPVILVLPVVGPLAWFTAGRRRPRAAAPRRPVAPDDDPDFLRSLDRRPPNPDDDRR